MSKVNKKIETLCGSYTGELKEEGATASIILVEGGSPDVGAVVEMRGSMVSFIPLLITGLVSALESVPGKALREELLRSFTESTRQALKQHLLDDTTVEDEDDDDDICTIKIPRNSKQGEAVRNFLRAVLEDMDDSEDED